MRVCSRSLLIALISSGMLTLQVQPSLQAAPAPTDSRAIQAPLAVVVLAELAHIGNANAAGGTTVYPGDTLDTEPGGELRLTVAGGQVYLLSDSAANVLGSGSTLQAAIVRGTLGFSSLTDQQFQIVTPEGIVGAADGPLAYGQVTITGANDIVISAYTGALALHRGSQTLIVKAGQSYYVSLVPDPQPPQRKAGVVKTYNFHLVWRIIVISGLGTTGYLIWRKYCESPVDP
ncbi:MAG TPA: hypothetical protein VFW94_15765 [Candidatus Acidoferrales bacterium]|nr:hypothetical protein [Candidatus Acidoferrales bacterium]